MKSDTFMAMIKSGEINDLKTMVAGYWLMENKLALQLEYKKSLTEKFTQQAACPAARAEASAKPPACAGNVSFTQPCVSSA